MHKASYNLILTLTLVQMGKNYQISSSDIEQILDISLIELSDIDNGDSRDSGLGTSRILDLCNRCHICVSDLFIRVENIIEQLTKKDWEIVNEMQSKVNFFIIYEIFKFIDQPNLAENTLKNTYEPYESSGESQDLKIPTCLRRWQQDK